MRVNELFFFIFTIFSEIQKQLSVLPENINGNNEDPGVNSDDDDYDAEVGTAGRKIK